LNADYYKSEYPNSDITGQIIACAMEIHSFLGPGLLEKIYEEALAHELSLRNIRFERQKAITLIYKGKEIGDHRIDFVVEDQVILELKAVDKIVPVHEAQLLTYLKILDKRVGLLINFNVEKIAYGIKRMVL